MNCMGRRPAPGRRSTLPIVTFCMGPFGSLRRHAVSAAAFMRAVRSRSAGLNDFTTSGNTAPGDSNSAIGPRGPACSVLTVSSAMHAHMGDDASGHVEATTARGSATPCGAYFCL
jgi:hypothetical protein